MQLTGRSSRQLNTGAGAKTIFRNGWAMAARFDYVQAAEVRRVFAKNGVQYLFIGKAGAILLGFPDTTQDADVFLKKTRPTGAAVVRSLVELDFELTEGQAAEIKRCKDFIQLKNGPFDLDLIFAPAGIENFEEAWNRHVEVEGYPVCHLDDIIASKEAADRVRDRETLPRLRVFRDYWVKQRD